VWQSWGGVSDTDGGGGFVDLGGIFFFSFEMFDPNRARAHRQGFECVKNFSRVADRATDLKPNDRECECERDRDERV
jgi:hypothetical protein